MPTHYALNPTRMESPIEKTDQLEAACRANGLITLSRTLAGSDCQDCIEAINSMTMGERHRRQEWERLSGWTFELARPSKKGILG